MLDSAEVALARLIGSFKAAGYVHLGGARNQRSGGEMQRRFIVKGKTYIVDDLDMERVAAKKVQRIEKRLPPAKKEIFHEIMQKIGSVIIWSKFSEHVEAALREEIPLKKRGNYYDLMEGLNKIAKRTERWLQRNQTFTKEKIEEHVIIQIKLSRSICRIFDTNATCWNTKNLAILLNNE